MQELDDLEAQGVIAPPNVAMPGSYTPPPFEVPVPRVPRLTSKPARLPLEGVRVVDMTAGTLALDGGLQIFSDRGYQLQSARAAVDINKGIVLGPQEVWAGPAWYPARRRLPL